MNEIKCIVISWLVKLENISLHICPLASVYSPHEKKLSDDKLSFLQGGGRLFVEEPEIFWVVKVGGPVFSVSQRGTRNFWGSKRGTRNQLASLFSNFESLLHLMISFLFLNCLSYFQRLPFVFFWHLHIYLGSFGNEKRVIEEITSLDLFTCVYQVFINNYLDDCIPQLDTGSLIGIRSHSEIDNYISCKEESMEDNAWLKMGWDPSYSLVGGPKFFLDFLCAFGAIQS